MIGRDDLDDADDMIDPSSLLPPDDAGQDPAGDDDDVEDVTGDE